MKQIYKNNIIALSMITLLTGCTAEFLEVKPQKNQVVVETLQDVSALLDNLGVLNRTDYYRIISDGDLYYTDSKVASITEEQRNLYLWQEKIDPTGRNTSPWDLPYQQVMYANVAMETLNGMSNSGNNSRLRDELHGRALFYRAWAHYNLVQDFAEGADHDGTFQLGVPIIRDSSYPKRVERASLEEAYQFIAEDLIDAEVLLPERPDKTTRPSKQAVYALMSRVYLNQYQYSDALSYVDKALGINDFLLDYNGLNPSSALPFSEFDYDTHPEIIFFTASRSAFTAVQGIQVANSLVDSYDDSDLRRSTFLNEDRLFVGTYSGTASYHFTGLAIDELYLTKAECLVRTGEIENGLTVLQKLLSNRYEGGVISLDKEISREHALLRVLAERRKELIGRGTRWTDLKRLNRAELTEEELVRTYDGQTYSLPPNSPRYVFEIPLDEIEASGLEQNNRYSN